MAYVRLDEILPDIKHDYYRYTGSFTTPPCTEGDILIMLIYFNNRFILKFDLDRFRYSLEYIQHQN